MLGTNTGTVAVQVNRENFSNRELLYEFAALIPYISYDKYESPTYNF